MGSVSMVATKCILTESSANERNSYKLRGTECIANKYFIYPTLYWRVATGQLPANQRAACCKLTNQKPGVGQTFHLSQLQTVFCGFSIFSVLKQINVDRNMKNILSPDD